MITPSSPPGPKTGTDHDAATLAVRARSPNGIQLSPARALSAMIGAWVCAATPTGPPAGPTGSRDQAASSSGGRPSAAEQTSSSSARRWMHSRSLPRAAPSADRMSDRLDDGSADTSRSVSPCSRVSWRRAEESSSWPDSSAITSSGCTSAGMTSAATRPCRSTTMRSASRNIWSMSWQASKIPVPDSRSREIMPSTWADICTPRAAVGSSSSSIRGAAAIALATATSWRWPPDSERTLRVVSCSGTPSCSSSRMASVCIRTSDRSCRRRSRPSIRLAAMSRLSHSARSCQTTPTPCLDSTDGSAGITLPATRMDPRGRLDVPADAPDQRRLARPVLPGQGDDLALTDGQADPVQSPDRAVADRHVGHRQQRGRPGHVGRECGEHVPIVAADHGSHHFSPEPSRPGPPRRRGRE